MATDKEHGGKKDVHRGAWKGGGGEEEEREKLPGAGRETARRLGAEKE